VLTLLHYFNIGKVELFIYVTCVLQNTMTFQESSMSGNDLDLTDKVRFMLIPSDNLSLSSSISPSLLPSVPCLSLPPSVHLFVHLFPLILFNWPVFTFLFSGHC